MSLLFKQNKICRFHGVPHPQGTNCTGIDYDPSQEPAAQPEYEAAYHNDKDGTDAAGRVIDKRGKLVATRPVKKEQKIQEIKSSVEIAKTVVDFIIEKKPETKIVNSVAQPKVTETVKALTKDQVLADPIIPSEEEKSKD